MTKLSIREKIDLRKNLKQRSPAENVALFYKRCMSAQELLDEATNTLDNEDDGEKNHSETFQRDVLLNFVLGLENSLQEQILASDAFDLGMCSNSFDIFILLIFLLILFFKFF